MPYCPSCSYEYEDYVSVCPDCEVQLAAGDGPQVEAAPQRQRPPELTPEMGQLVPVANVPNRFMAILVKSQLEDAGIPVLFKTSAGADVGDWNRNDFVSQDIWVPEKLAVDARRMIYGPERRRGRLEPQRNPDETLEHEFPLALDSYDIAASGPTAWITLDSPAPPAPTESNWRSLPTESEYLAFRRMRKSRAGTKPLPGADDPEPAYEYEDDDSAADDPTLLSPWQRAKVLRWLMGLLMLAWTLPFLLQFFQMTADMFDRLFK